MRLETSPTGGFTASVFVPARPTQPDHHACEMAGPWREVLDVPGLLALTNWRTGEVRYVEPVDGVPGPCTHPPELDHWYHSPLSVWRWDPDRARAIEPAVLRAWRDEQALIRAGRDLEDGMRCKPEWR